MPLFSVVIPLFNKEKYIEETIKSVLNQSFKDFELLIINDGSTDNSLAISKKLLSITTNSRIITQKNIGLSATRNNGVKEAKGELIAFIDADDLWFPDFLQHIYNLYKKFPEASLYGTTYIEKYANCTMLNPKKNLDLTPQKNEFLVEDFFEANMFQPIICQSSFAGKRSVFIDIKFNEEINYSEDIDFYIRSNMKFKLAYYNLPMAIIQLDIPDQITSSGIKGKIIPDLDLYEKADAKNYSLKKYLDFYRYTFLIQYKLCGNTQKEKWLLKKIDLKNLTLKQRILIKSPIVLLRFLKGLKKHLIKYKIRLTSF